MSGFPPRSNATNELITGPGLLAAEGWATEPGHPTLTYLDLDELKKIMRRDNFSTKPTNIKEAYADYATFLLKQQRAGSRGKSRGKSIKKRKSRRNRTGKKSIKKRRKSDSRSSFFK